VLARHGGVDVDDAGQEPLDELDRRVHGLAWPQVPVEELLHAPVGIGGGGKCACADDRVGSGGDVKQTNLAAALGIAFNANSTDQSVKQSQDRGSCKCGGDGIQAVGQSAWSGQAADADADAFQLKPSNHNGPVRIGSAGAAGSVRQANAALAFALAANLNRTKQEVAQTH
jgi:hypothetical protein